MDQFQEILRLFVSQALALSLLFLLIPLRKPVRTHVIIIIISSLIITSINAIVTLFLGREMYTRIFFLTVTVPHILVFAIFSHYKWGKLIFALVTVQVIGNLAVANGLLASYLVLGAYHPLLDIGARLISYALFFPLLYKYVRPAYLKMATILSKGWWILNTALALVYVIAYVILFVPTPIFSRPIYFIHAYLIITISLFIYLLVFFLFHQIDIKTKAQSEKEQLSKQVISLAEEREEINTIAYIDGLTGIKNRYSLFRQMDYYIENNLAFLVLFIDLDNFKMINDEHDHAKGDVYLKTFAHSLQKAIGSRGDVFRFAGDEFVCVIHTDITNFDDKLFEQEIVESIVLDIAFYGLSYGKAHYPSQASNADDLINLADQAMYAVKREKKIRR